ncbi:hypothetical protein [Peribacillus simplex]|uniref:hypothetical protein n=1 Tax=Peribacillus simplex TaxID=1478 RepID=UPI003D2DE6E4
MEKIPVDWLRYVWIIPIVVGFVTFVLTSLFTVYRERKNNNISKRIFIEYAEYEMNYPLDDDIKHGEGIILLGKNGKKITNHADEVGGGRFSFMVIKNITENNVINVKLRFVFSDRLGKQDVCPKNVIEEEFFMPVWKNTDTIYIPAKIYKDISNFTTNEELVISYTTTSFEHFKYSYERQYDGNYKEQLKKRYLGFIWITKINYQQSQFYSFIRVVKKKNEEIEVQTSESDKKSDK